MKKNKKRYVKVQKIGIIGHFGGKKVFYDGQTIKTKSLERLLNETGKYDVYRVDTYYKKKHPIKLFFRTISCMLKCKKVIVILSVRGLKAYTGILRFLNFFLHRKLYYSVIGSTIINKARCKKKKYAKKLSIFNSIWFEYQLGTDKLLSYGIKNVKTVPNFKYLCPVTEEDIDNYKKDRTFRYCTFSRVMEEKGITDAITAVKSINDKAGKVIATLDVYGNIDDSYRTEFNRLTDFYSSFVTYKGAVSSMDSVKILQNYYALLFPTTWRGEGFPGTILDSFASGVPVIASDWKANKELVKTFKTGLVYPNEGLMSLVSCLEWANENVTKMRAMRKNCMEEYKKYTPEVVGKLIINDLNKE